MAIDNLRGIRDRHRAGSASWCGSSEPVRARLEIAEIADRCMKSPGGGPALLFEQVLLEDGSRSAAPGRHQSLRIDATDLPRARRGAARRDRRPDRGAAQSQGAGGLFGKLADAAQAGRSGQVPAQDPGREAALPGGRAPGRRDRSRPDPVPDDLAGGRRALHHPADGDHRRPGTRHPQRRDVPGAGARPRTRWRCTGSATRAARPTGARWRNAARRCRW